MREFSDNRHEILARCRETLARLADADRRRRFEEQQRAPVDAAVPMPPADWHNCKTTAEMTGRQFDQWCRDGKPALRRGRFEVASNPVVTMTKAQVDDLVRAAIDQERANTQASLEALAEILGAEVALIENKMRADFKAEIEALRAEVSKLQFSQNEKRGGDDVLDLPDWRSHVAH